MRRNHAFREPLLGITAGEEERKSEEEKNPECGARAGPQAPAIQPLRRRRWNGCFDRESCRWKMVRSQGAGKELAGKSPASPCEATRHAMQSIAKSKEKGGRANIANCGLPDADCPES